MENAKKRPSYESIFSYSSCSMNFIGRKILKIQKVQIKTKIEMSIKLKIKWKIQKNDQHISNFLAMSAVLRIHWSKNTKSTDKKRKLR